ncbi:glycine/betaine ABC transporter ATP-binding protein [Halobacillus andaensis]|uniref:Carnitine transport ATP-binding protein OpuCA n=1 Tax=Halobacillus andaensis TaxID=1176239 RepID=A0A917AYB9_HALAA|nr:ABC transporter ATP-binding protein [Halobacillus andaensis]MBP2003376.1 osmoprotectant transport system ATP-binding protein [Halobacillus andaensis]GGF10168.1 glycine/betaine ABC transporter ATP-binding protein [Halobacillus andaensis]
MITFKDVTKTYPDGTTALKSINLSVNEGELLTLIGPSGCGKTTTMKMINRLIEPTDGEVFIHNKNIKEYNIHELRWNIGYVLQEIALFPHMTIEENISIVPEMKKWDKKDLSNRIDELMSMVGLDPSKHRKRKPSELSGGQQQRVGVLRALAGDPDIILMDEPFSALDPISREQLQKDILSLHKKIKKTIVFVTHDIDEAMAMGDRVCLMQEGEIVQVDKPQQLILHPANDFVESFIGERKSPWQTAVDVIIDQTNKHVFSSQQYEEKSIPDQEAYVVKHSDGSMAFGVYNGKKVDMPVIEHGKTLAEAMEDFNQVNYPLLPVTRNHSVIGTLSYKDMVLHLQKQMKTNDEVTRP